MQIDILQLDSLRHKISKDRCLRPLCTVERSAPLWECLFSSVEYIFLEKGCAGAAPIIMNCKPAVPETVDLTCAELRSVLGHTVLPLLTVRTLARLACASKSLNSWVAVVLAIWRQAAEHILPDQLQRIRRAGDRQGLEQPHLGNCKAPSKLNWDRVGRP